MLVVDIPRLGLPLGKNKVARNEKWKKQLWVFVYMANFEAFCQVISSSINFLFLKSALPYHLDGDFYKLLCTLELKIKAY